MTGRLSPETLRDLAIRALVVAGASEANARPTAQALIAAELDGLASHGLSRLPFYAEQVRRGKVDGHAVPVASRAAAGIVKVDARSGFAFPAIDLGIAEAVPAARETGIAVLAIGNSHHCGVAG